MMPPLQETTRYIQQRIGEFRPQVGIILGTGLGALAQEVVAHEVIPYEEIPHFPVSTVETHKGKLIVGELMGQNVMCLQGRFHYYEGYSMQQVVYPVRVMQQLGVRFLFVSNAAGGMNPTYKVSDLMLIEDHISLFLPENPLIGKNDDTLGERFPDMSEPYDAALLDQAQAIAQAHQICAHRGVYVSVPGPQLETKAEYRLLRLAGGDAVGMSTVPEIIAGVHGGLRCFGISVITDMGIPETLEKAELAKIIAAAEKAEPSMTLIMKELLRAL
ncbi:MAG: purine-nucleoside phosphorylase [Spirosomataceae bacterium]